jgi:hypothetical protein
VTISLDCEPRVVDVLRGDRQKRPRLDTTSAAGLRAQLEDGIHDIFTKDLPPSPLVVRPSSLRESWHATDLSSSTLGLIRGALVTQLLRLRLVGVTIDNAFDDAVAAWRADAGAGPLLATFDQLDGDDRARLATDVTAHDVTLSRCFGQLPSHWMARSCVRATQRLAGGHVILRDVVDLTIGANTAESTTVVLVDVTTSPLGESAERTLRFHALVETLRTSVVPLRSAVFSSATGEFWTRDIEPELLARSVDDVLEVLQALWSAR